ncbi:MAG: hypothetical protein PWP13_1320 [Methanothermobacter sp.]|nr:hypothetical protein [Methanothermobacter sp.]
MRDKLIVLPLLVLLAFAAGISGASAAIPDNAAERIGPSTDNC